MDRLLIWIFLLGFLQTALAQGVTSLGFLNMKLDSYVDLNNETLSELITEFLRKILESAEFEVAVTYIENEVIGLATNATASASATDQT
ncbi:unnamed protein product [Knipowitschia caucasica]|uniref:Uncharacterized protein n=1 Tax=Knipowitschia caucasica TaxID=637954 RepID=A0AAV2KZF9_KNICA